MIRQNGKGFIVIGKQACLHILFYGKKTVRFAYSRDQYLPASTIAVIAEPEQREAQIDGYELQTGGLIISVNPETLAVEISDQDGKIYSEDIAVSFADKLIRKKILGESGIYGNGEKYTWLNQIGTKTTNYCSDVLFHNPIQHPQEEEMHTAIPFYLGASPDLAYGIYFDNTHRTYFDFGKSNPDLISFQADGGNLDYYFIAGPQVADVVKGYGHLTGTAPLPRKSVLGYHQSRYSYSSEEELLAVAEDLRKYDIPCSVLYMDIHYMDAYKVFTVDRDRFKNFESMLKKLKDMGFLVVVIVNPGVKAEKGYAVYEEGLNNNYYVTRPSGEVYYGEVWPKPAVFPDFLRSEVRQWWGEKYRWLLDCGVGGIWNDMNEPTDFTLEIGTLPADAVHKTDDGVKLPHREVHNIYAMLQTMSTRTALEGLQPDKRSFVLTRAAFAGSQRYAALWTGDNASVWEHLENSIPMLLNLGLSGYSFVGADVGGYRGDCSGELLVRWTQLGAFYPFFRNHSEIDTAPQEPWTYPQKILDITRKYIRLRYRLLTHYYNLMRESTLTGQPAIRPLFYHYQDDPETYHINDQFLLGESLMVCPVTRPGANHRQVYFPQGLWFDYWSGEPIEGGRYLSVEAPLEKLPLYVRAGTILPHDDIDSVDYISYTEAKSLTMHCYAGQDGRYRLYLDDGFSDEFKHGRYSELEFFLTDDRNEPGLTVKTLHEGYAIPGISYKYILPGSRK